MPELPRLFRTSAVRLALAYVSGFGVVLCIALVALWWSMRWFAGSGLERELAQEFHTLAADPARLVEAVKSRLPRAIAERRFYLVAGPDDEKTLVGNLLVWPQEPEIPLDGQVHGLWVDEDSFPDRLYSDAAYMPVVATRLPDGRRLLLARGGADSGLVRELTEYLTQVVSVATLLALVLGIIIGRAFLRRMDTVSRTATAIMRDDLSQRVPLAGRDDEFDALAGRLNAMLDRIQQLVRGQREVTDNVAHDLRRPLSRLRNRMEVTLLEPRSAEEYRQALGQGLQDADALINTFNMLLDIAQAEAGRRGSDWGAVNLNDLAHDLFELYGPAAEEKQMELELEVSPGITVRGSRNLLAQAVGNLLENAIKYSPPNGRVRLDVRVHDGAAEVEVTDNGPGIPEDEREHVLERFVRLDSSRNTPGNGLGLSLVKAAASAHHAQLLFADAAPGLKVTLRFAESTCTS